MSEELLAHRDKHSVRNNIFIDKFLVEVSNLLQPLVDLPPLPGARRMLISGRVQVDRIIIIRIVENNTFQRNP